MESTVVVAGNVGAEVVWREHTDYEGRATFTVASTPRVKRNGEWADGETTWYRVTCWRRLAARVRDSLHKGDPVVLGGRLTSQRWLNEAGVQQLSLEIDAEWVGHDLRRGTSSFARVRQRDADAPNETEWDAERRAAEDAADEQRIDERSEVVTGV